MATTLKHFSTYENVCTRHRHEIGVVLLCRTDDLVSYSYEITTVCPCHREELVSHSLDIAILLCCYVIRMNTHSQVDFNAGVNYSYMQTRIRRSLLKVENVNRKSQGYVYAKSKYEGTWQKHNIIWHLKISQIKIRYQYITRYSDICKYIWESNIT